MFLSEALSSPCLGNLYFSPAAMPAGGWVELLHLNNSDSSKPVVASLVSGPSFSFFPLVIAAKDIQEDPTCFLISMRFNHRVIFCIPCFTLAMHCVQVNLSIT